MMMKFWTVLYLCVVGVIADTNVKNYNLEEYNALCNLLKIAVYKWSDLKSKGSGDPLKKALGRTLFGERDGDEVQSLKAPFPKDYEKVIGNHGTRYFWSGQRRKENECSKERRESRRRKKRRRRGRVQRKRRRRRLQRRRRVRRRSRVKYRNMRKEREKKRHPKKVKKKSKRRLMQWGKQNRVVVTRIPATTMMRLVRRMGRLMRSTTSKGVWTVNYPRHVCSLLRRTALSLT
ncbi:unnamed protein product [Trypanosoma congolense IL3000]|uniref:WGS project CAEQ00000000 data, annotated contig 1856 n=1 Tax=Trypanosoma congolense (strain IL3000) TaxID=1068625 RepID=F9W9F9_TRYCI|nr:unnamed protein product [Trypanosoma congolense IL3000]